MPYQEAIDLAVLDFAVYCVASSTHRGDEHGLRISYVPRVGPESHWASGHWKTAACPYRLVKSAAFRLENVLMEAVEHQYSIVRDPL